MTDRIEDHFLQHVLKLGLLTDAQIQDAVKAQAEQALKGETVPVGRSSSGRAC